MFNDRPTNADEVLSTGCNSFQSSQQTSIFHQNHNVWWCWLVDGDTTLMPVLVPSNQYRIPGTRINLGKRQARTSKHLLPIRQFLLLCIMIAFIRNQCAPVSSLIYLSVRSMQSWSTIHTYWPLPANCLVYILLFTCIWGVAIVISCASQLRLPDNSNYVRLLLSVSLLRFSISFIYFIATAVLPV